MCKIVQIHQTVIRKQNFARLARGVEKTSKTVPTVVQNDRNSSQESIGKGVGKRDDETSIKIVLWSATGVKRRSGSPSPAALGAGE